MTSTETKPRFGPRRRQPIRRPQRDAEVLIRLTPAEKARIEWTATAVHLSVVAFVRSVGLGQAPRPLADQMRVRELLRVHGHLGGFGGLLKLWLTSDHKLDGFDRRQVRVLLAQVEDTRTALLGTVRWAMHGKTTGRVPVGEPFGEEDPREPRSMRLRVPVTAAEKASILAAAKNGAAESGTVDCAGAAKVGETAVPCAVYLRARALSYQPHCVLAPEDTWGLQEPRRRLARVGDLLKAFLMDDPGLAHHLPARVHQAIHAAQGRAAGYLQQMQAAATTLRSDG